MSDEGQPTNPKPYMSSYAIARDVYRRYLEAELVDSPEDPWGLAPEDHTRMRVMCAEYLATHPPRESK